MRPGVNENILPTPASTAPLSTGTWFSIGVAAPVSGSNYGPYLINSINDFVTYFGARGTSGNSLWYDAVQTFFNEGGKQAYVCAIQSTAAAALATFITDFGPGQVSAPGIVDNTTQEAVITHANTFDRIFVGDLPDVYNVVGVTTLTGAVTAANSAAATTDLTTDMATYTALALQVSCGGFFAPWVDVAPLPGSATNRCVPPSAFVAGKIAASDAASGNPNLPAAGDNGKLATALVLHSVFADSDAQTLNAAGVNLIRTRYTVPKIYGFRTGVNATTYPNNWMLNNARLAMAIGWEGALAAEHFVFSQIDSSGVTQSRYAARLKKILSKYYKMGAIYGNSPQQAYAVDTGSDINTAYSESQGNLIGTMSYYPSPEAELVTLNIYPLSITQQV